MYSQFQMEIQELTCRLTISYAMKELAKVENDSITEIGKSLSKGSLMGARGNSGVILSQIIRGLAQIYRR